MHFYDLTKTYIPANHYASEIPKSPTKPFNI